MIISFFFKKKSLTIVLKYCFPAPILPLTRTSYIQTHMLNTDLFHYFFSCSQFSLICISIPFMQTNIQCPYIYIYITQLYINPYFLLRFNVPSIFILFFTSFLKLFNFISVYYNSLVFKYYIFTFHLILFIFEYYLHNTSRNINRILTDVTFWILYYIFLNKYYCSM